MIDIVEQVVHISAIVLTFLVVTIQVVYDKCCKEE
jgi:hypothetical protein